MTGVGSTIAANDYNTIQSTIAGVLGQNAAGYGQALSSSQVASNAKITAAQWNALQNKWIASGQAVECTTSKTVGDIKAEIEELCSRVSCDDLTQTAILNGLNKIKKLGVQ